MSDPCDRIRSMLDRNNEARRKLESQALFFQMLKNPHLVKTPAKFKGTRKSDNEKSIKESRDNG